MATDFSKYLRDNWPLGWAINKAKSAHNTIGFESGGFTFVIEGASFDPGEPPTRDSDGQAACIAWANDGGVYISNPVAGVAALWPISWAGERLFMDEHENKIIALLDRQARLDAEDRAAGRAGVDGPTSDRRIDDWDSSIASTIILGGDWE